MKVSAARLLARTLGQCGVEYVSGIPGHTIFPFANIVRDEGLKPFLVRHEAIGAFAADVYYRLSGQMMALFTHTVPGTANIAVGLANAYSDSSAMILISGETARDSIGRGAYQELSRQFDGDVFGFTRHLTKRSWVTQTPYQVVEHALRAAKVAQLGRPGPVSMHVYQDIWHQEVDVPDWPDATGFLIENDFRPSAHAVDQAAALIHSAKRPLIVAGNGVNLARAQEQLAAFADQIDAYVATTVTGKGAFPENHPRSVGVIGWVGTSAANLAGQQADLVIAIGARLTETATSSWQPGISFDFNATKLIQCDVDAAEIANVYPVDVALVGDAKLTLDDLTVACTRGASREWGALVDQEIENWRTKIAGLPDTREGLLQVAPIVRGLRRATVGGPVNVVCDVGKHHKWVVQQFEVHVGDAVVSSMGAGTMGLGPCGAIGAALARPEAKTFGWTGDGGLSMVSYVLPTIAEHQLPITMVTIDDGAFGEIVNIQEERFGQTIFSEFNGSGANPKYRLDVTELARACGIPARRVETPEEIDDAFAWATAESGPTLIDFIVDRKSRVPSGGGTKLTDIWNYPVHPWAKQAK